MLQCYCWRKSLKVFLYQISLKIIKIIFYKNKFIDFLCFKGFIPPLTEREGMIIPYLSGREGMIIPSLSVRGGMNIPLSLDKKDMIKKNDVPPTRGRESMGFPSPRAVPRGACVAPGLRPSALRRPPSGQPSGKENPYSPSLLLEVYTTLCKVRVWYLFRYLISKGYFFNIWYLNGIFFDEKYLFCLNWGKER